MADDVARLLVQVSATTELLRSNLNKAEAAVAAFERSTNKKTDSVDRNFSRMGRSLNGLKSQLAGVAAGFSLVLATKQMAALADESSRIQAQLRLATRESGNFSKAQEDVRRIAAGTRSDLGAVASLYAVMTRNSASLGATQDQVARATDTVTKAFKVSGASTEEASAATRQLSQALASGTLRGDEFNSIMENGPRLAKLLADSLGVPIGKLRDMSQAGELTSAKLFAALNNKKFTAGLDAEFKEVPATFSDAMTAVKNAAIDTFGAFDRGGKFSQALFNFAQDGSENLESVTKSAEENGRQIRAIYEGLSSVWEPFKNAGIAALEAIGIKAGSIGGFIRKAISFNLRNTQAVLNQGIGQFLPGGTPKFDFADRFDKASAASDSASRRTLPGGHGSRTTSAPTVEPFTSGTKKKGPKGESAATKAARAARLAERQDDALDKFNNEFSRNSAEIDGLMAQISHDLRARADAEIERLDADKSARIREIRDRQDLSEVNKNILIAQEEDLDLKRKAIVEQQVASDLVDQENDILADRLDTYRSVQDVARTAADRADIEQNILALQQEIERATLEQLIAVGRVTNAEEARANLALRQKAETVASKRRNLGPGASLLDSLPQTAGEINEALQSIEAEGLRSLNDGITEAIVNGKSLGSVFKSVANSIISDLVRIAVQQAIIKPLGESLFGGGSGGGGLFSSILNFGATAFGGGSGGVKSTGNILGRASGGPVNAGQPYIVGEKRPELFVPRVSGTIVPNIKGLGGQAVHLVVNAPGATAETVMLIRRELANAAPTIAAAASNMTTRNLSRQRL